MDELYICSELSNLKNYAIFNECRYIPAEHLEGVLKRRLRLGRDVALDVILHGYAAEGDGLGRQLSFSVVMSLISRRLVNLLQISN